MNDLIQMKNEIEECSKIHQIEILRILSGDSSITLNENNNGIFRRILNSQGKGAVRAGCRSLRCPLYENINPRNFCVCVDITYFSL